MKKIFISYSHTDEYYKNELIKHLFFLKLEKKISSWDDVQINPGIEWDEEIKKKLEESDIILLLVSSDAIISSYIRNVELKRAMSAHDSKTKKVVPIIVRQCPWKRLPLAKIQVLPKHGKPLASWDDLDEALYDVVEGIAKIV